MSPSKPENLAIKYAMMPHDLFQRRWYVRLRRRWPDIMERWFWLVCLAQNARSAGRVMIGGEPATAEDVAIAWDRRSTDEDIATWQQAIDALVEAGILKREDGCLRIDKPTGWYLPPSKQPHNRDFSAEWDSRKDQANAARRKPSQESHGNAREMHGQAREGSGTHVHSTEPNHTEPNLTEPCAGGGEDVSVPAPTNGKRSWSREVVAALGEHLPGDLSTQDRQAICRIAETGQRVGATPLRSLEAIRRHAYEVAYETQFPDHGIRYPRQVALKRALNDIEANPLGPVPHPWDVDSKRGDQA